MKSRLTRKRLEKWLRKKERESYRDLRNAKRGFAFESVTIECAKQNMLVDVLDYLKRFQEDA